MEWKPRYIVSKAQGVGGNPIPADEPVLVIRAQDLLAVESMCNYIKAYDDLPNGDPEVMADLGRHLSALIAWQAANPEKIKVADRGGRQ